MTADKKKTIIAVTGYTRAGKSLFCEFMKKAGCTVIDVDGLAKSLYRPGRPLYRILTSEYGRQIAAKKGGIDRAGLATRVFSSTREYRRFTKLVYPHLVEALDREIAKIKKGIIVIDMAVLFESNYHKKADTIIYIKRKQGLSRKKYGVRRDFYVKALRLQKLYPERKKIELSDFIIYNNKNKNYLKNKALGILGAAGGAGWKITKARKK